MDNDDNVLDNANSERLHPNWRALASVNFERKIFVRSSGESESSHKSEQRRPSKLDGSEVKAFYESVLSEPSTSTVNVRKPRIKRKSVFYKPTPCPKPIDLFKAAENDDHDYLRSCLREHRSLLNERDAYGWSLLMAASRAGSVRSIQTLVSLGADKSHKDKSGNTCFTLAKNDRITKILLQNDNSKTHVDAMKADDSPYNCKVCGLTGQAYTDHVTSTVHLLKSNESKEPKVHYVIPEANKGFQIMLNKGWQSNKGLGPKGKTGKLYPVKTSLKHDRKGLGSNPSVKKVTHFEPFDTSSVADPLRSERSATTSKKRLEKQKARDRQKEVEFRRDFF